MLKSVMGAVGILALFFFATPNEAFAGRIDLCLPKPKCPPVLTRTICLPNPCDLIKRCVGDQSPNRNNIIRRIIKNPCFNPCNTICLPRPCYDICLPKPRDCKPVCIDRCPPPPCPQVPEPATLTLLGLGGVGLLARMRRRITG